MSQIVHKVIMAGCGGVGKSAITLQFMYEEFVPDYEPTKADSYRKNITINSNEATIDILDTAGQEEYQGIRDFYYRAGEGFLVVFAINDRSTFDQVREYINVIRCVKNNVLPPMILVGNKSDLSDARVVSVEEATNFARTLGIPYVETSACTRHNVNKVFYDLCGMVAAIKAPLDSPDTKKAKKPSSGIKRLRCAIL